MYKTLYNVLVNSRSLVYIVDMSADGIQENVSIAAVCPDSLILVCFILRSTYQDRRVPHSCKNLHCFDTDRILTIFATLRKGSSRLCLPIKREEARRITFQTPLQLRDVLYHPATKVTRLIYLKVSRDGYLEDQQHLQRRQDYWREYQETASSHFTLTKGLFVPTSEPGIPTGRVIVKICTKNASHSIFPNTFHSKNPDLHSPHAILFQEVDAEVKQLSLG